ncbi:MAG: glycerol-3-phosphate 1-O-acyltransferase PlsY [Butyricicoccaceae bacterium]
MQTVFKLLIIGVVGYLCGSFNSAIVVSKTLGGFDIRTKGSGNAGLTNVHRTMGGKYTLMVLAGDIIKAAIALLVGGYLMGPFGKLIAGAFVIAGHVFPLYFGFKGGKGVLVGATMIALFDWRIFLILLAVFILMVALTKWISLGSICGAIGFPILTWVFYGDVKITVLSAVMAAAVIFMHRSNIVRILHGTENKLSLKGKNASN